MIKSVAILALTMAFFSTSFAQLPKDVFPLNREFKKTGFYVSPQATVSFGNRVEENYTISDTSYSYEVEGRGKWGYGIEAGWFKAFDNLRFIDFLEAGASYRVFKGAAKHEGVRTFPNTQQQFESENEFSNQLISISARAVNAKQIRANSFLTTAVGVNYNYQLAEKYDRSAAYPLRNEEFLATSSLQLHLQIGIGFRVSRQLLLIPTLETPLVTAIPTNNFSPAFPFFSARYYPLIIGLKFMFLREDPVNCNAPTFKGIPSM